jgi:hypothetical protein
MKSKRRKKLVTIVAPKAILQDNVTRINKIGIFFSKGSPQVAITSKIELLVTTLFISSVCRGAWFVKFGAFKMKYFQPLRNLL